MHSIKITGLLLVSIASITVQAGKTVCKLRFSSSIEAPAPTALAFSNNDECLAVANISSNSVSIYGFDKDDCHIHSEPRSTLTFGAMHPLSVAFSPVGNCLAVYAAGVINGLPGAEPSSLSFFSFDESTCTAVTNPHFSLPLPYQFVTPNQPQAIAFSPDGKYFAFANLVGMSVDVFTFDPDTCSITPTPYQTLPVLFPLAIAFSHDSRFLAATAYLGEPGSSGSFVSLFKYDSETSKFMASELPISSGGSVPLGVAFSPSDCCLAVTNYLTAENNLSLFKVHKKSGTLEFIEATSSGGTFPVGVDYSPNGNCLAVGNESGTIGLLSVHKKSCEPCKLCTFPSGPSRCPNTAAYVQYSHSGCCLAVANLFSNNVSVFAAKSKRKK